MLKSGIEGCSEVAVLSGLSRDEAQRRYVAYRYKLETKVLQDVRYLLLRLISGRTFYGLQHVADW